MGASLALLAVFISVPIVLFVGKQLNSMTPYSLANTLQSLVNPIFVSRRLCSVSSVQCVDTAPKGSFRQELLQISDIKWSRHMESN